MSKTVKRLKLRLFLEGVEVPAISAVVNAGVNTPATASIQIIPTDNVHRIKPRTLVHVFFLDLYPSAEHATMLSQGPEGYGDLGQDLIDENYRLLFAGEVIGYTFAKQMGQRQAVLQCMDFTTYWDAAKQYFHTGGGNSSAAKGAAFVGSASVGFEEDSDSSPTQMLVNVLKSRPSSAPNLRGLLGGIVHLFETIGGTYSGVRKFRGLNDFFSASELRLRLVNMMGASSHDTSSAKLFNHKSFSKWIKQHLARNKSLTTFRDLSDGLMERIYHDYVSIPTPAFHPGHFEKVRMSVSAGKQLDMAGQAHVRNRIAALRRHETITTRPNDAHYDVSRSDVMSDKEKIPVNQTDAEQITRDDAKAFYGKGQGNTALKGVDGVHKGLQGGKSKSASKALGLAIDADRKWLDAASAALSKEGGGGGVDQDQVYVTLRGLGSDAAAEARNLYEKALKARKYRSVVKDVWITARMPATVFRPNIYFVPPPRCNVIFPDRYESFSFRRSFLQEVTRLQLSSQKEWKSDSLGIVEGGKKNMYYAPNIPDVTGKLASRSAKKGIRFILEHEIYTGIIPVFETIGDIAPFASIARKAPGVGMPSTSSMSALQNLASQAGDQAKEAAKKFGFKATKDEDYLADVAKKAAEGILMGSNVGGRKKIHYLQRIANFNFYLRRFMPRSADLSLPFSPYLLPGFPVLVVDRYMADSVQNRVGHKPTQYLGMLQSLTHSVSQQGGTTSVQLTCCRTDDERAEFLAPFSKSAQVPVGTKTWTETTTGPMGVGREDHSVTIAEGDAPFPKPEKNNGLGPRVKNPPKGKFSSTTPTAIDLTEFSDSAGANTFPGATKHVINADSTIKGKIYGEGDDLALIGHKAGKKGTVIGIETGPQDGSLIHTDAEGNITVLRGAAEIQYRKTNYKTVHMNVPPEKALFPGWMSPIYSNVNIGRHFYKPLFSVGSITDPLIVGASQVNQPSPITANPLSELSPAGANKLTEKDLRKMREGLNPKIDKVSAFREGNESAIRKETQDNIAEIKLGATIRQAVIEITKAYKELKSRDRDLDAFFKGYGWRPIASLPQVLGSTSFDPSTKPEKGKRRLAEGEGFHSRAFGPYQGLQHLEHEAAHRVFRKGRNRKVAAKIDPRLERFLWAQEYFNTLSQKAQLG